MKDIELKFYVLNYDINNSKVINFNIFNNCRLRERMIKELKKYVRSPKKYKYIKYNYGCSDSTCEKVFYGFEAFCEELRSAIAWQEWSRREYEISVGDAFEEDANKLEKWDCYSQALPNIDIIAREIIYQYKQQTKKAGKK